MCVHDGWGQMEDCKGGSCSEGEGVRERGRGGEAVVDVFQNLGTLLHNRGTIGRGSNDRGDTPLLRRPEYACTCTCIYAYTWGVICNRKARV